jgi:hypothetical protein
MDSLSQSNTPQPPNDPALASALDSSGATALAQAAQATEPQSPSRPSPVSALDLAIRLILWAAVMLGFISQSGGAPLSDLVYPLLILGLLSAGYLLASLPSVAADVRRLAENQPLLMAVLSLFLLLPLIVYARSTQDFDFTEVLFTGVLIVLPTAGSLLNAPQLRRGDISLGLIMVALPLLLPFARDETWRSAETFEITGVLLRLGAFALPVLLLALTTQEQKQRLNFLFVCAVLSLWYSVEFDVFPSIAISETQDAPYFQFAVIPLFLYVLALAGRFDRLGLSFSPTPRGLSTIAANTGLFAVIALPVGLVTGFLAPGFAAPTLQEAAVRALQIFLFVALPEEILFRGTLLTYLLELLGGNIAVAVAISSLIFGAAHLNNTPNAGWFFVLATIAGFFYARAFLATRNVATAGVVHAAVDWLWWLIFRG